MVVLGTPTTRELDRMLFYTDTLDHWAYEREFSLQTLLSAQTPMQIIGKRLFELAAAAKLMYTTLDIFLPVAVAGGCFLLVYRRDQDRLLLLLPSLFMLLIILIAYPILIPYKSQAGSFKKAYLTILPMLIPVGIYAVEYAVPDIRLRVGGLALAIIFTAANAFELVRADTRSTNNYLSSMRQTSAIVQGLPDINGDNKLILMTQDPFMLRFVGVQSVMIPFESREKILKVAARYRVDYLLMPADRPSLDSIYWGKETDSHISHVLDVNGTTMKLYRFDNP